MHTVNTETKRRALGPDRKYFCNEYCPVKPCCAADRAGLPPGLRDVKQCNHECMIRETNYERYEQQVQRHMILFHSAEGNFADKDLFRNLVHHDRLHLCEFKPLNAMESLHAMRDVPIKDYRPKGPPPCPRSTGFIRDVHSRQQDQSHLREDLSINYIFLRRV